VAGFQLPAVGREYIHEPEKPQLAKHRPSGRPGIPVRAGGGGLTILVGAVVWMVPLVLPPALTAQEGAFSFQVRGGVSLPVLSFRDEAEGWEGDAGLGSSFGMGFNVPLPGPVGAYFGFSQHRFRCDSSVCPDGESWISTGFDLALRFVMGTRRLRPWLQGGLHTHRVEGRVLEGSDVVELISDGAFGFEAGGGILVQIGNRMSLSPGLRFGQGTVPFSEYPSLRVQYLIADLGLVVGF